MPEPIMTDTITAEVARLRARVGELEAYNALLKETIKQDVCMCDNCNDVLNAEDRNICDACASPWKARIRELEATESRLREALEKIANTAELTEQYTIEIFARTALNGVKP